MSVSTGNMASLQHWVLKLPQYGILYKNFITALYFNQGRCLIGVYVKVCLMIAFLKIIIDLFFTLFNYLISAKQWLIDGHVLLTFYFYIL